MSNTQTALLTSSSVIVGRKIKGENRYSLYIPIELKQATRLGIERGDLVEYQINKVTHEPEAEN